MKLCTGKTNTRSLLMLTMLMLACFICGITSIKAQEFSAVLSEGGVRVGYDGGLCDSSITGALRYNSSGGGGGGSNLYGAGGGAYSQETNVSLTPSSSVTYAVGAGGSNSAGGDTYFCDSSSNCASIGGSAVVAGAKGGSGGGSTAGGSAASGVGTVKYSGGSSTSSGQASGGGGAGGPNGNGGNVTSAGGSGGGNFSAGGAGGQGLIVITYTTAADATLEFCNGSEWANIIDYSSASGSGANSASSIFSGGSVQLGYDSRTCDSSISGTLRYNSSTGAEYCNGTDWVLTSE